jgi:hypothetical protein
VPGGGQELFFPSVVKTERDPWMKTLLTALALLFFFQGAASASDELATATLSSGETFSYILTTRSPGKIAYGVILMPGGPGRVGPRMEGPKLVFAGAGNFLIRSREIFADPQFVAASTDATTTPDRILAIVRDLDRRYGRISIYVIGTSRSTESTMALAKPLDGQVAGFVHTSSMNGISGFDPRGLKSRHLIVSHRMDGCRVTRPSNGASSHSKYGTEYFEVEGGISVGDDCEAQAYHGYNGIEAPTIEKIKAWILAGR